ncbi:MAG: DUF3019 domain-containing protein [Psychrobium sp.]|nr:DUF3019 domain-containing protein [Psychrobium sp.]
MNMPTRWPVLRRSVVNSSVLNWSVLNRPVLRRAANSLLATLLLILCPLVAQARPFLVEFDVVKHRSAQPTLQLSPDQCVALMQGQACYVTVQMQWRGLSNGEYCLYSSQKKQALHCWSNLSHGVIKQSFNAKKNIELFIKRENSSQVLIAAQLKMAWVYKKKGRPRVSWRMF